MSVRLTSQENRVALFDSVTGFAFGPTLDSEEEAEEFLAFVAREDGRDPRDADLEKLYGRFLVSVLESL